MDLLTHYINIEVLTSGSCIFTDRIQYLSGKPARLITRQSSRLAPTRFVYFVHHLDYRLDDVHSPNAGFRASTSLHLAHRIHKNRTVSAENRAVFISSAKPDNSSYDV